MSRKRDILQHMVKTMETQREYLNHLDAAIGDGDHGNNMCIGFESALEYLSELDDDSDPQIVLHTIGRAFGENVGGAAGPLYAIAFKRAATACSKDTPFNVQAILATLEEAIAGIQKRGRVVLGEKTLLDVLLPVYNTFKQGQAEGLTISQCLTEATRAAKIAADSTKEIPATKGRASYLGIRSIGHLDPGAMGLYLLIREFVKYYQH